MITETRKPTLRETLKQLDPLRRFRAWVHKTPFGTTYKNLGHHPSYWYWLLRGKPARTPHLVKQHAVLDYAKRYGLNRLVETGTYYGEMVDAMKRKFAEIHSIEFDPDLARRAAERFSRDSHVHIYQGDSQQLIQEIVSKTTHPTLFWLDAGYYGWNTVIGKRDRLIVEMESILGHHITDHVILLDDAHGLSGENGAPTVELLSDHLHNLFPNRLNIEVENDILRVTPRGR